MKAKKIASVLMLIGMFVVVALLSSCDKSENASSEQPIHGKVLVEKSIFVQKGLDSLILKQSPEYGVFLSFRDAETLKKYEDFLVNVIQSHDQEALVRMYQENGFSPLFASQSRSFSGKDVYYDELSSLLLNSNCVIEVGGNVFVDRGNNFVHPNSGRKTRSTPAKDQDSDIEGGCMLPQGHYSILLKTKLRYSKPIWSDERVELESHVLINAPGGAYGSSRTIEHYYQCDLYVGGRSITKTVKEKGKGPVLKSLVAKGDKIEFGYCYATTTSYCDNEHVSTHVRLE